MYVDRPLSGVHAVQALSRLNRVAAGKQAPFVLDFVNSPADIADAFAPYYDATELRAVSDPYQLDRLKHDLDGMQVYYETEIDRFAQVFYLPPHVHRLSAYVRLYAFLSQIIPYADCDLERLYSYGRKLLPHLHVGGDFTPIRLDGDIDLEYYRLQRVSSGAISLDDEADATVASPTAVGTRQAEDDAAPLSEIIELLNDRYKTDFTESDRLFLQQIQEAGLREEAIRETARANDFDKFRLGAYDRVKQLLIARLAGNDAIVDRCLSDPEFGDFVITGILQSIFDTARSTVPPPADTPTSASTSGGET